MKASFHCLARMVVTSIAMACSTFGEESALPSRPLEPAEALVTMSVADGLRVELVAAEPLVLDPVAFDWGTDGELWVVEMADYPSGEGGRVVRLTDSDGDGALDRRDVFLDRLSRVNGVMAWRDGAIVSAAPEIFFAADVDGDGRSDARRTLFRGFSRANPQHLMNGFVWGLDNLVHAGGEESQVEIAIGETGRTTRLRGDFRFDPDDLFIERESGRTQFGRARNDAGDWFGTTNSDPGFHVVLEDRYLARNPHLRSPGVERQVAESPGAAQVFPTSRTAARFNDLNKANRFTSACGLCIYRDDLLGDAYRGNSFVCEPVHNLVHREVLSQYGVTWTSRRADEEQDREFLSSSDPWFRPAVAKTGPDGAVWIADMYRETIEHPEWIPDEWEARLDVHAGSDRGRIYRVVPVERPLRPIPRTKELSTDDLVELLRSPNGTARDMAHEELYWRGDPREVEALARIAREHENPACRAQALAAIDGLDAMSEELLDAAMKDADADVRRLAVRSAESRLADSPALLAAVEALADDPAIRVRMQVALSLGEAPAGQGGAALARVAVRDGGDPYVRAAVFSSATRDFSGLARVLADRAGDVASEVLSEALSIAAATWQDDALARLLTALERRAGDAMPSPGRVDGWLALRDGLRARSQSIATYREQATGELRAALDRIDDVSREANATLDNEDASPENRVASLRLLTALETAPSRDRLTRLLGPGVPRELQEAALDALPGDAESARATLTAFASYGPRLRGAVLDWLLARDVGRAALLDAIDAKALPTSSLDAARRQVLLADADENLRNRAAALLGGPSDAERGRIVESYREALTHVGDATRGVGLFDKHCATCHRVEERGHAVGPDLSALSDRSPETLLVATLDPNRAVETKYLGYAALDSDGRLHQGLLVAESGAAVELLAGDGKRTTLLASEIEQLKSSGQSLMPVGFERDLSPRDLSDLFAFLGRTKPLPKQVPGNQPRVVAPEGLRGEFWLLPRDAELHGPSLAFDEKRQDLSAWRGSGDFAAWTLAVEREGRYRLSVEIARSPDATPTTLLVDVAGERIEIALPATGSDEVFAEFGSGDVRLSSGAARVAVRPADAAPEGETFRLRSVRLMP